MSGRGTRSKIEPIHGRPHRTEASEPHTRKLFCRSASVLGRPRPTEPPQPHTHKLFCQSAVSLGPSNRSLHPYRQETNGMWTKFKTKANQRVELSWVLLDGGGRGRTRSDRRAFVCAVKVLLFAGGELRLKIIIADFRFPTGCGTPTRTSRQPP